MRGANLAVSTVCTLVFGATPIFVKYFEDGKFHKFLKAGEAFFSPQIFANNWIATFFPTKFFLKIGHQNFVQQILTTF